MTRRNANILVLVYAVSLLGVAWSLRQFHCHQAKLDGWKLGLECCLAAGRDTLRSPDIASVVVRRYAKEIMDQKAAFMRTYCKGAAGQQTLKFWIGKKQGKGPVTDWRCFDVKMTFL